jgi:hypothetical protein
LLKTASRAFERVALDGIVEPFERDKELNKPEKDEKPKTKEIMPKADTTLFRVSVNYCK